MTQEYLEPQVIIHVNKHVVECYWKECDCNLGLIKYVSQNSNETNIKNNIWRFIQNDQIYMK